MTRVVNLTCVFTLSRSYLLFDLEIAFLFPWAVAIDQIGISGLLSMVFFLFVLIIGFIYEWKKGALDWD